MARSCTLSAPALIIATYISLGNTIRIFGRSRRGCTQVRKMDWQTPWYSQANTELQDAFDPARQIACTAISPAPMPEKQEEISQANIVATKQ